MARNLEAELNEADTEWPPCWRPQEGETLVGTILRYSSGQTQYGPCRTAILQRADGKRVSLWLSSVVLLSLFEREKPRPGEKVGLRYLGKHPTKNYKRFALVVDRPEAPLDFSPLGGEQGQGRAERTTDRGHPYAAATIGRPSGPPPPNDDDDPFSW